MNTINITVSTRGNITPFEINRAIANREEYLAGFVTQIPRLAQPRSKVKIKEGAGLWNFIQGCLP